jgi:hypothetical protein
MESVNERQDKINWVERGITIDNPVDDPNKRSYLLYPFRAYRNTPREVYFTLGIGF